MLLKIYLKVVWKVSFYFLVERVGKELGESEVIEGEWGGGFICLCLFFFCFIFDLLENLFVV